MSKKHILWVIFGLTVGIIDMFFDWTGEFTMGVMIGAGVMGLSLVWEIGRREIDKS